MRHRCRSAQITLDLIGWAHMRITGVAAGPAQSASLSQQVPALVEFYLDRLQPGVFGLTADLAALQFGAQILLFGHERVDP
jgi:hypothetical protein